MSILPHHNHKPLRYLNHGRTSYNLSLATRIYCSTTATNPNTTNSINTKQLVSIEPKLVENEAPKSSSFLVNDPSLQSTWSHRAWLASGCSTVLFSLAKSISGATDSHIWVEPILAALAGYILADLGSGVYHWGIDNYGNEKTPIFGSQIEAFQGHHKFPWTITKREFSNNLHSLAKVITFTVMPINLFFNDPILHGFVSLFSGCIMFSQQFHAWAHGTKSKLPTIIVGLQDVGILVSRSQHGAHHRPPYNNNYCIVSGVWNDVLDESKFFEVLEMIFYFKFGVRPRSWCEPNSEWVEETEDSDYIEDRSR